MKSMTREIVVDFERCMVECKNAIIEWGGLYFNINKVISNKVKDLPL